MITKEFKIYGRENSEISLGKSVSYDWSTDGETRIVEIDREDKTGTSEYVIFRVTRDTAEECESELNGQLSDGFFENEKYGKVEEVKDYIIRDREAGNVIAHFGSLQEAKDELAKYEAEDKKDGTFTENFYEIVR